MNAPISRRKPPTFEPLTSDLRRMHLTVTKRFEGKVAAARDALSPANPGASTEEILETALDLLLERAEKRKGIVARPRKIPRPAKPDHIPAAVKQAVWLRDGERCQFMLPSGEIPQCRSGRPPLRCPFPLAERPGMSARRRPPTALPVPGCDES